MTTAAFKWGCICCKTSLTDYNSINDIYKNIPPKIKTMEELENAIKAINTGKSEDIYGLSIENIIYAGEDFQLTSSMTTAAFKWGCICCKTSLQWRLWLCQYCPEVVSCYMF
jgi:hypothetical protein